MVSDTFKSPSPLRKVMAGSTAAATVAVYLSGCNNLSKQQRWVLETAADIADAMAEGNVRKVKDLTGYEWRLVTEAEIGLEQSNFVAGVFMAWAVSKAKEQKRKLDKIDE